MDKVDWSRPIEAVHEDGRVEGALLGFERRDGLYDVTWPSGSGAFYDNGAPRADWHWTIRNVATPAPKYPDALVERMVGAIKQAALGYHIEPEARAIVAELPAEVDADLVEARAATAEAYEQSGDKVMAALFLSGALDKGVGVLSALAAVRRRALEREQAGEGRG